MLVFHVDVNSAYLSWTAAALLEQGYNKDIREVPSAIAGDPENRHGIILTKSAPAKKYGIKTGESIYEARKKYPELEVYPPDYNLYLLCSEAKMDPKVVQKLMGHSSISVTLNIYTHVLNSKMDEEIKKFGVAKTEDLEDYSVLNLDVAPITAMSHT